MSISPEHIKSSTSSKLFSSIMMWWPEVLTVLLAYPVGLISGMGKWEMVKLTLLLIGQNFSFTIVSRARQSTNLRFHALAAIASNGFYIFVITTVVAHYDNFYLKIWYIVCTVVGSVHAHHISLHKIEKSKHFKDDSMISRKDLDEAVEKLRQELKPSS